jgi:hypothetical protein
VLRTFALALALALALGFLLPNGCLQQIAANRFSTPQDVIAILLQGFVRRPTTTPRPGRRHSITWILLPGFASTSRPADARHIER